jgi:hypothetical protein
MMFARRLGGRGRPPYMGADLLRQPGLQPLSARWPLPDGAGRLRDPAA